MSVPRVPYAATSRSAESGFSDEETGAAAFDPSNEGAGRTVRPPDSPAGARRRRAGRTASIYRAARISAHHRSALLCPWEAEQKSPSHHLSQRAVQAVLRGNRPPPSPLSLPSPDSRASASSERRPCGQMPQDGSQRPQRPLRFSDAAPKNRWRDSAGGGVADPTPIGIVGEQMGVGGRESALVVPGGVGPEAKRLLGEREKELRRARASTKRTEGSARPPRGPRAETRPQRSSCPLRGRSSRRPSAP